MGERNTNCELSSEEITVLNAKTGSSSSMLKMILALVLWIGPIYFNLALATASFFFLPSILAFKVLVPLIIFMVIPLNNKSNFGDKISRFICKQACGYFPVMLHVEDIKAFHPNEPYVLAFEPHSVFPVGALSLLNHTGLMPLPKIKFLSSSTIFYVPFLRQIWTWIGHTSATRKNFVSLLNSGYSCIIVPGGMREMLHMESTSEVVFLKERKGFVRIAIETGCPLVPVFCFGQTNSYKWWKPSGKWYSHISRALRFTPVAFWGILGSPLPYQNAMHVVVGRPIELKKNPKPTMEEVSDVHNQFIEALEELFEKHKVRVGHNELDLIVI